MSSAVMLVAFLLLTYLNLEGANETYKYLKNEFIVNYFSWYYVGLMSFLMFLSFYLVLSKYGNIRIGGEDAKPEFSNFSWFSMLFSAGIGIGILFWSIAEPIYYFQSNPFMDADAAKTEEAARIALRTTIFHWGLHGWALFAVFGLSLAYFAYNKNLPLTVSSALYPLLGDKVNGPIGMTADLLAIFATAFGISTSLGLGSSQIVAGVNHVFGTDYGTTFQIAIIIVFSVLATLSVLTGLHKGLQALSRINIQLTFILLGAFFVFGPTVYLLGDVINATGDYLESFIGLGAWVATGDDIGWQGGWTIFYWGWWISWGPFVGIFIARISKGRTIKEFVIGTLVAPVMFSLIWIVAMGGTAMYTELFNGGGVIAAVNESTASALFTTIELLGHGSVITNLISILCVVMLCTYYVTSADSATLVIANLVNGGQDNTNVFDQVFWGMGISLVAIALLLMGGLGTLQAASIVSALPFSFIVCATTYALMKALKEDAEKLGLK